MSPEQVRGKPADARSDIFSFGAILYEMLSGKRAFHGDSAADTMSAILREDPPDLSVTNQNISPALERIVRHSLEKNPEQRFQSARDLAFNLEAVSGTSVQTAAPAPAPPAAPAHAHPSARPRRPRRRGRRVLRPAGLSWRAAGRRDRGSRSSAGSRTSPAPRTRPRSPPTARPSPSCIVPVARPTSGSSARADGIRST